MSNNTSLATLAMTIKTLIAKGDKSADKAEQFYKAAGLHLKELKARKPDGVRWDDFVRQQITINRPYADRLISIADGRTTLSEVRSQTAARNRKHLAKLKEKAGRPDISDVGKSRALVSTDCDCNPEDAEQVAESGDSPEIIRRRIFLHRAAQAWRHASENGLEKAADSEIDKEIVKAAQNAAEAWSDLGTNLEQRIKSR